MPPTRLLPLIALVLAAAGDPRSGYLDAGPAIRAMQDDDAANPGFLWVRQGEALWSRVDGPMARSCADCHGDAAQRMAGVAATYPRVPEGAARPVSLTSRVRQCQAEHQGAAAADPDSEVMLSLTAYLGFLARGRPIAEPIGERERAFQQAGQALFETRMGQFNLSCAQCHDGLAGQRLAGSIIPQGHPNGYPQYRLEWQTLGSLHRRIRNCLTGVRAEALAADSDDFLALELFLHRRAHGLVIETPAVRP